jgi:hypothetical protein
MPVRGAHRWPIPAVGTFGPRIPAGIGELDSDASTLGERLAPPGASRVSDESAREHRPEAVDYVLRLRSQERAQHGKLGDCGPPQRIIAGAAPPLSECGDSAALDGDQ